MAYFKHQQQVHQVRSLDGQTLVDDEPVTLALQQLDAHHYLLRQGPLQQPLYVHQSGDRYQLWYQGEYYELQRQSRASQSSDEAQAGRVEAPLTGKVILVSAIAGEQVKKGATLVVLESMKMETALTAPADALIKAVHCTPGDPVGNGQLLVELEPASNLDSTENP